MNILIIGPLLSNAKHGAECGIYDALKELDHNVSAYDYRAGIYISSQGLKLQTTNEELLLEIIKGESCDVVLAPGPGLPDEVLEGKIWKKHKGCLKINWNSEPIRLEQYATKIQKQRKRFDLFFTFDESEIPLYKNIGISAAWLPQAFNPEWYKPIPMPNSQRFDGYFCFIGSVGGKWLHREHFLRKIRSLGYKINVATIMDAEKVNKAYNMHLAVLNLGLYMPNESGPPEHLKSFGLQQRIFESIGAGKICITNEIPTGTNQLFEHGKNILFYNQDNLGEVLEMALNKKEMKQMEENIENIRDKHNYKERMERLVNIIDW